MALRSLDHQPSALGFASRCAGLIEPTQPTFPHDVIPANAEIHLDLRPCDEDRSNIKMDPSIRWDDESVMGRVVWMRYVSTR